MGSEQKWFESFRVQRIIDYLFSLKFWLHLIGLWLAFQLLGADPNPINGVVKAVFVFLTFISMAFNMAVEDGLAVRQRKEREEGDRDAGSSQD